MTAAGQSEELVRLFEEASASLEESNDAVESASERNKVRMGRDRSYISVIIIATYFFAVLGTVVYIIWSVPLCEYGDCRAARESWSKQADLLLNLVVTAVLPIVTLMLGFYFGTEKAESGSDNT